MPHRERGILDRIDRVKKLLAGVDLVVPADLPSAAKRVVRAAITRIRNAELELNEIQRLIERSEGPGDAADGADQTRPKEGTKP